MSFELPLFPLNVVLFPGMPMPLHIFEPRYRLMIARCLESDRTFGIALLTEGVEGQLGTEAAEVGCTAEITEVAPFADGRLNLQSVGGRRFRVLYTREEDDYLVGTCEWLQDDPETEMTPDLADRVQYRLRRYLDAFSHNTALSSDFTTLDIPDDGESLSLFVAAIMTLPNSQKQQLLEMTCTDLRLELEEFLLERAEIVQRAYARRVRDGYSEPPGDSPFGHASGFVSLN